MRAVWRFIKRWWWTFLLGAAAVGGVVLLILLPKKDETTPMPGEPPRRTFKDRAKVEVERVRLEGEVEKARTKATADVQREQIDQIEEVGKEDPEEGRRQMAAWLAANL